MTDEIEELLEDAEARQLVAKFGSENYIYWSGYVAALKRLQILSNLKVNQQ